jgi:ketosteroid isomerase-like protein
MLAGMSDSDAVLAVNQAFYDAFTQRDAEAMDALWAKRHPVTCIHPGWPSLSGRDEVVGSWRAILGNPSAPAVRCLKAEAHVAGEAAWVVCYEVLEGGSLVATNVFAREGSAWRMVHHQAGAAALPDDVADHEAPKIVQ